MTIIEDVTATRRRTLRLEFLAQTTNQVLASSLDYQETLRNVTSLAVPQIADWCAVDLFNDEGGYESVAVAHTDPTKLAMAERLRAFEADQLDPAAGPRPNQADGRAVALQGHHRRAARQRRR